MLPGSVEKVLDFLDSTEEFCNIYQSNNNVEESYIYCDNVTSLSNTETYSISARITILNAFTTLASDAPNFGKVLVYPYLTTLSDYYETSSMYEETNTYAASVTV